VMMCAKRSLVMCLPRQALQVPIVSSNAVVVPNAFGGEA
jgi:hypothetical protein